MELVDGGFAHNSPIEAAVLWGATHVVLIEASPKQETARGHFAQNIGAAFSHLHQQAQLLDARSRGQVTVFTLAPEPPHICVLDFSDNLIADSIARGYRAARSELQVDGVSVPGSPRFRKELGEPVFTNVKVIR